METEKEKKFAYWTGTDSCCMCSACSSIFKTPVNTARAAMKVCPSCEAEMSDKEPPEEEVQGFGITAEEAKHFVES